ncbi:hypothetical protein ACFL0M_11560 [Thermodesulfobacteriota bacterium]
MFSEDWDLDRLNREAFEVIRKLEDEGIAKYFSVPGENFSLPASANIETAEHIVVVCSGYPEHAGVWSYTLLDKSFEAPEWFEKTSMEPYFRNLYDTDTGLIALNPHAEVLKQIPDETLEIYLFQLQRLYEYLCFTRAQQVKLVLLGFSLGGEVVLRFLQTYPRYTEFTNGLILIDPVPPRTGRQNMSPELSELVDKACFYGVSDSEGRPEKLAAFTQKILNITPEVFSCQFHGEMPNLVWPRIFQALPAMFT